jgi:hypothetical protein
MENYMKIQHISHPLHGEHLLPECPLVRHAVEDGWSIGSSFTSTGLDSTTMNSLYIDGMLFYQKYEEEPFIIKENRS